MKQREVTGSASFDPNNSVEVHDQLANVIAQMATRAEELGGEILWNTMILETEENETQAIAWNAMLVNKSLYGRVKVAVPE